MKKVIFLIAILSLIFTSNVLACVGTECNKDSNVGDTNDGNKGYIFTYDCEKGNESLGKWVNPSTIPELKGQDGINGINGQNGTNGVDGQDGYTPIKDVDYTDGKDGIDGKSGQDGAEGKEGKSGATGATGLTGKGLKDRQELQLEVRLTDTKKTSIATYYIYDLNNQINTVGIKFTWKMGESYEEKRLNELENQIKELKNK
jgi:peptidoglycan hydrolase CwlO-like protein